MTIRNSSCTCPITLQPKEEEERYYGRKEASDMMPMPSKLAKIYLAAHLKVASGIVPICRGDFIYVCVINKMNQAFSPWPCW